MTTAPEDRAAQGWRAAMRRPGHPITMAPGVVVLAVVLLLAARSHGSLAPAHSITIQPLRWDGNLSATNGALQVDLSNRTAGASVAPAGAASLAVSIGVVGVQEIGSNGAILEGQNLSPDAAGFVPGWTTSNQSTSTTFAYQSFQEFVPTRTNGGTPPAPAQLTVTMATAPSGESVTDTVLLVDWPWLHATDAIVVLLSLGAVGAPSSLLKNGTTDTLDCGATVNGSYQGEQIAWPSTVLAFDHAGDEFEVPVASTVLGGPANATLAIGVAGGSGGYTSLDAVITIDRILPPAPPARSVPLDVGALAVGWIAVVGTVAWAAVRRSSGASETPILPRAPDPSPRRAKPSEGDPPD